MSISGLNHYTIRCTPENLASVRDFYIRTLEFEEGDRPDFPFAGHWLYCAGQPIVHLAALLDTASEPNTGPLDHLSFRAHGLKETRTELRRKGVSFDELPVPGWPLYQIFLVDPAGLKVELTFDMNEEAAVTELDR